MSPNLKTFYLSSSVVSKTEERKIYAIWYLIKKCQLFLTLVDSFLNADYCLVWEVIQELLLFLWAFQQKNQLNHWMAIFVYFSSCSLKQTEKINIKDTCNIKTTSSPLQLQVLNRKFTHYTPEIIKNTLFPHTACVQHGWTCRIFLQHSRRSNQTKKN